MSSYEYKTVAMPQQLPGRRFSVSQSAGRMIAESVSRAISAHAVDGWEYYRTETFSSIKRTLPIIGSKKEVYYSVMIFRRKAQEGPLGPTPIDLMME